MEFFEVVRRHMTPVQWKAFVNDAYSSPVIRSVLAEPAGELTGGRG
jgi:hypothetical protein